jgi:spore coat polysaccharide biosynthesis predicted glycosyltransferase SpsG
MGHYMRMTALADAFTELGCTYKFYKGEDEPIDYSNFDIVILDTYQINDKYIASLNVPGRLVVCYDDNSLYTYSCDIILNANFYAEKLVFRFGEKTPKLLLGPYYALLRREFREAQPITVKENPANIFICFGGSDSRNFTPHALRSLLNMQNVNLTVILGAYTRCDTDALDLVNDNVQILKNPDNLPDIMMSCDMAITAAGSMVYELAAVGLPAVVITQAENQNLIADYLQRNKLMRWIGDYKSVSAETIQKEAEALLKDTERRKTESARLVGTVNKNGALNATYAILEVAKHENRR